MGVGGTAAAGIIAGGTVVAPGMAAVDMAMAAVLVAAMVVAGTAEIIHQSMLPCPGGGCCGALIYIFVPLSWRVGVWCDLISTE